ncbi:MAG: DUF3379 family protein [Xanthomonadales bacterium]|nr:DUF3379 family protein [Xanthomonadales bacterium]
MDLNEFNRRLNEEPRSDDPELKQARNESLQHAAAYRDAQQFEDKLEQALRLPVEDGLADSILEHCLGKESAAQQRRLPAWLGIAASIAVAAVVAVVLFRGEPVNAELRDAFVEHVQHPEGAFKSNQPVDSGRFLATLASAGVEFAGSPNDVTYFYPCDIGGKRGLHWVVTDDQGQKTTVLMIPGQELASAHDFRFEQVPARMLPTSAGAMALFGHQGQDLDELASRYSQSITALPTSAGI